ncbi:hypothetical protein U1Q18_028440 [Sarracenia purpurea var. burkii]
MINVFEELANLLSKSAFPVNCPLSSMHLLALDGLITAILGMVERISSGLVTMEPALVNLEEYTPFWTVKCDSYSDPDHWVPYTAGLDKNLVEDFLGNHDEFCVQVLNEFAGSFDFQDMNLDTPLQLFLETFRLPGESQKIQRCCSLVVVKKKMTEEDFIRNNRHINGGNDLPRKFLLELYQSICKNEIRTTPEQGDGFPEMTPSRWIDVMHKSKKTAPFILSDSKPYLDHDMFTIMSGRTIAAISVVFDHAEHEEVYQTCIDGFLAVAKISACHHLEDVLDGLVVSLCKFTTLLNPSSVEEPVLAFGDDTKARMATVTVFTIANRYGDFIRTGWRNILDCILKLHKLGLLPARVANDTADDLELSSSAWTSEASYKFFIFIIYLALCGYS